MPHGPQNLADARLAVAWALVAVFTIAGIGKLFPLHTARDGGLAAAELVLAGFLVVGLMPFVTAAAALVLAVGYAAYAFVKPGSDPCRCFGQWLPHSTLGGQRFRNLTLLVLASTFLFLWIVPQDSQVDAQIVDRVLGIVLGVGIVAAPWLWEWLAGSTVTASQKSNQIHRSALKR